MKKIKNKKLKKYAAALRAGPGAMIDPELTDEDLVDQHIWNLIKKDYRSKVVEMKRREALEQVTEEDLEDGDEE